MQPEDEFKITITNESVTVDHPKRKQEQIRWNEIEAIKIITTDEGPWQPDVWLALLGRNRGCVIPQGAAGYDDVYDIVAKYEHFSFENVIKAMGSTENAEFLIWTKNQS